MERKLFGTDGPRGVANQDPMTGEVALRLGRAVAHYFQKRGGPVCPKIVVGKDTRLSCYMLEQALAAGVCSQGGEVILMGPLPTPGVAFVTESMRAQAGVMISASHNPFDANGMKIFDAQGYKLPDEQEWEIERLVFGQSPMPVKLGRDLGRAQRLREVFGRYIVHVKSAIPQSMDLEGMRLVLDCAHGAGHKVAPMIFQELGAEVITMGNTPDGTNINLNCGAVFPQRAQRAVAKYRADLGICLDGDGDRVVLIDELGRVIHGDQLLALLAQAMCQRGELREGDEVVGTIMSNRGPEEYVEKVLGLRFFRTPVGDRYLVERMRPKGGKLAGEPSGHVICHPHSKTGDGCLVALKALEAMIFSGRRASELVEKIFLYPQVCQSVAVARKIPFEQLPSLQGPVSEAKKELGQQGRLVLRYSGTEPVARVMVESPDAALAQGICGQLSQLLEQALGA